MDFSVEEGAAPRSLVGGVMSGRRRTSVRLGHGDDPTSMQQLNQAVYLQLKSLAAR